MDGRKIQLSRQHFSLAASRMPDPTVSDLYYSVIDDVCNKVAAEFENANVPEHLLLKLKEVSGIPGDAAGTDFC
jgi:hypothetical protein